MQDDGSVQCKKKTKLKCLAWLFCSTSGSNILMISGREVKKYISKYFRIIESLLHMSFCYTRIGNFPIARIWKGQQQDKLLSYIILL